MAIFLVFWLNFYLFVKWLCSQSHNKYRAFVPRVHYVKEKQLGWKSTAPSWSLNSLGNLQ